MESLVQSRLNANNNRYIYHFYYFKNCDVEFFKIFSHKKKEKLVEFTLEKEKKIQKKKIPIL
jgi:hypothetical protein